ncbi:hypothetical protein [Ruminococcus sp.]|jgi:hypothetical protein|uniref:hypothetical protein n=1 Tax=Ruminococcus sp. TaxID=41978 RepID=UPI002670EC03|nr:hypothetical protein [uncultured Ruminococcus sp.]
MSDIIFYIIAVVAVILVIVAAMRFKSFRNWLVFAVSEAEKYLGSGTGKLKIRYAYDLAVKQYPTITKIIPWCVFSKLVDAALVIMRQMIDDNKKIAEAINKKTEE